MKSGSSMSRPEMSRSKDSEKLVVIVESLVLLGAILAPFPNVPQKTLLSPFAQVTWPFARWCTRLCVAESSLRGLAAKDPSLTSPPHSTSFTITLGFQLIRTLKLWTTWRTQICAWRATPLMRRQFNLRYVRARLQPPYPPSLP